MIKAQLFGVFVAAATSLPAPAAIAQNPATSVNIDVAANRHPINPLIYGVNFGTKTDFTDLQFTSNRWGGNQTTRYNWQLNAYSSAADWFFESRPYPSATPGAQADMFISQSGVGPGQTMMTIPMLGWVANLGPNRTELTSYSVTKYGAQCKTDRYLRDAGDGRQSGCRTAVANDPTDANIIDNVAKEQGWLRHMVATWGKATQGGVGYYLLDNEPSDWWETHVDVHPVGTRATEGRDKVIQLSAAIRSVDPTAKIMGPEEWGWWAFQYSGYDQQYQTLHNYCCTPEMKSTQGGLWYLPWLLASWKSAGHPIDILSVHYYPSGPEYFGGDDVSTATQLLRNRSTRELWDPNYISESWINSNINLISSLRSWVNTYYYKGTPIAITEYNWGAEDHINGATAQADILGIFGREGLDMANRFEVPASSTPTYKAMKMYRNVDDHGTAFGDISLKAVAPNPDQLAVFAAQVSGNGTLTIMAINKVLSGSTPVTFNIANFPGKGHVSIFQLTAANVIKHYPNGTWNSSGMSAILPPQSITLFTLWK